jgi:hypothetical protein
MKKRFTKAKIVGFLREVAAGLPVRTSAGSVVITFGRHIELQRSPHFSCRGPGTPWTISSLTLRSM